MCGRFAITLPSDAMAQLFGAAPDNDLPEVPNFNVCPTNPVHVVRGADGDHGRRLVAMRWGFLPSWYDSPNAGPLLINARGETLAEKPAFRAAARARRCVIPADGFYEWTKDSAGARLPWYIRPRAGGVMALAGIWQRWERGDEAIDTCAIVTCAANQAIARLHDRMPVILAPEDWPLWLGEAGHGAARLVVPAPEDALECWRVDPAVNSSRASGPALVAPLGV
ncbi:Putative SOS response-associated peptidase YedK [Roseovarius marisflavi]|uniref:Abasic site processing protein n=1 Tax=Roseovarius marisflavi TaxID=1054996 RepID=A0A1M7CBA6_9RHOB|nr:SOS response-associated peptidase [Roseovarius marisflavi]SHL64480.1 Putative SOS response-associated peptidase YedK [Roseovarius marisflavi]